MGDQTYQDLWHFEVVAEEAGGFKDLVDFGHEKRMEYWNGKLDVTEMSRTGEVR
jgi:hypothetical protein